MVPWRIWGRNDQTQQEYDCIRLSGSDQQQKCELAVSDRMHPQARTYAQQRKKDGVAFVGTENPF